MKPDYNNKILEAIKEQKLLDDNNFDYIVEKLKEDENSDIDRVIKNYHFVGEEEYAELKSTVIGVPYKNLMDEEIDEKVLKLLPVNLAKN